MQWGFVCFRYARKSFRYSAKILLEILIVWRGQFFVTVMRAMCGFILLSHNIKIRFRTRGRCKHFGWLNMMLTGLAIIASLSILQCSSVFKSSI